MGQPSAPDEHRRGPADRRLIWTCRLAAGVRLRRAGGRAYVVAERPLTVLEVRPAALRLLSRLPPGEEVEIAGPRPAELRLLRHLAGAGILDLRAAGASRPTVTVVVPVHGRPRELAACLDSLARVRYPGELLRVLVVDDGSPAPATAPAAVRVLRLREPRGAAGARNAGARAARSEVIAFLDSDCLADPGWLDALIPELADPEVAAAGGRIGPAAQRTWLERYEAVRSPLDLGRARTEARPGRPVPFLVTANLVVRRADLLAVGGFDERLRWGEDVDLCWRLHQAGRRMVYQPAGLVRHRHRGGVADFARTRANYAGSEAELLARHPDGGRWLGFSPGLAAAALGGLGALLGRPRLLAGGAIALSLETGAMAARLEPLGVPARRALPALLRGHAAGLYWAARQLTRYYGLPAVVAALSPKRFRKGLLLGLAGTWAAAGVADWRRLRPAQSLPAFLAAHLLDDAAYQYGLWRSCWRGRTLRPLRVRLRLLGRNPS